MKVKVISIEQARHIEVAYYAKAYVEDLQCMIQEAAKGNELFPNSWSKDDIELSRLELYTRCCKDLYLKLQKKTPSFREGRMSIYQHSRHRNRKNS